MPVQNFEINRQYWAVLKRIRSLMLMFCRNILLLWNILPCNQLFACKASRALVHSCFLAKQSIFNVLINLHAICILQIVQDIEVISLDPVHHNSFNQTTQVLQILLMNYILATWFQLTLPGQWFSAVAESNCSWSVSTKSDCTTFACTGDASQRFDSNVDHHKFDQNLHSGSKPPTGSIRLLVRFDCCFNNCVLCVCLRYWNLTVS